MSTDRQSISPRISEALRELAEIRARPRTVIGITAREIELLEVLDRLAGQREL